MWDVIRIFLLTMGGLGLAFQSGLGACEGWWELARERHR